MSSMSPHTYRVLRDGLFVYWTLMNSWLGKMIDVRDRGRARCCAGFIRRLSVYSSSLTNLFLPPQAGKLEVWGGGREEPSR